MAPPIVADPPDETDAQTGREAHYPLAGGIATSSTRTRTITRCATSTKTTSGSGSSGGRWGDTCDAARALLRDVEAA